MTTLREGYLPPETLDVDPRLEFHSAYEADVDPITHEVIRSSFWNINWDHQETIRRVSGSGIVVYGYDFNTSIQNEVGDGVVFGPGLLMFAGCADLAVKWTLEHRAGNIGISPGDVFIQNDPWVGTNHQMDVAVFAPIFVDGKLFSWVYNVVHQRDLGGIEPGGFTQTATDVYCEPGFSPPMKLVSAGQFQDDVADMWIRRSRVPELILLELKSQLAGIEFAAGRINDLIARYGAAVVKGVMHKMTNDAEAAVKRRLESIPDGTWRDVRYAAGSLPGVRRVHRFEMTIRKRGGHIYVSNDGTEQSTGAFNISVGQLRACVINAVLPFLAYDQYLCGAGVLRCITLEPGSGCVTSAHYPAAVSSSIGTVIAIAQSHHLVAKMLTASPELERNVFAASGLHTLIYNSMFGIDQHGRPYGNLPFDGEVGALGAFSWRDGFDHGGSILSTSNPVGSVEMWEREIPLLYLYRRELPNSGGHGRWRGGATLVTGWTGHKTKDSYISSGGLLQSVTQGIGLAGGFPATGGSMWTGLDTSIEDAIARGELPGTREELRELAPNGGPPPAKKFDNPLRSGDLFEVMPSPGAGYGDPVLREPDLVAEDVRTGRLTEQQGTEIYGVVLDEAGGPDLPATEGRRKRLLAERLRRAHQPAAPMAVPAGEGPTVVGRALATVAVIQNGSDPYLGCGSCSHPLGELGAGYRAGSASLDLQLPDLDAGLFLDPVADVDDRLVVRQYLCPSCGHCLDTVVCLADSEPDWDVVLEPESTVTTAAPHQVAAG